MNVWYIKELKKEKKKVREQTTSPQEGVFKLFKKKIRKKVNEKCV